MDYSCHKKPPPRQTSDAAKYSTPTSLSSRSLNFPISSKTSKPPLSTAAASRTNKTGVGLKKGQKQPQSSSEDVHSLKLLHNHYLQWTTQMANQFFSVGADISNLRDTVKRKRAELNELLRIKAVSTFVEAHMPYLDQRSDLGDIYTCSLSGATNALSTALLRIPVSSNVQVDIKERAEALDSAAKTTDMIVHHMLNSLPKAEEMDSLMSEFANVVETIKALVQEYGNLLLNTDNLQVEDCSLQGHLMQLEMYSSAPSENRSSKPSSTRHLLHPHCASQENHQPHFSSNHDNIPETIRSMDYRSSASHKKPQQPRVLFKENDIPKSSSTVKPTKSSRSNTPIAAAAATYERIAPSRFRLPQQHHRQTATTYDAAKLVLSLPRRSLLQTSSGSCQTSSKFSIPTSLYSQCLNLPLSFKTSNPPLAGAATKTTRPPQSISTKTGVNSKKGKKQQQSSQDVHSLKLLHNHYLQWRYANAKAEVSTHAQTTQMENRFFSIGADISNLRDTIKRKRAELNELLRIKAVSSIVEAQMPYLDQWCDLEESYTCSLSGAANALSNSLLRIPVSVNVQVNISETAEALDLAAKATDIHHMISLLPKAEEMDTLISELANVVEIEKAFVEECGSLLLITHNLQVEECSLRGHLMQLEM